MTVPAGTAPDVMSPAAASARLGVTEAGLVALLKEYRYPWTELAPGGRPGRRGRAGWGLTEDQYLTVLRGQAHRFEAPPVVQGRPPEVPTPSGSAASPDGKSRLRKGRGVRRPAS